MDTLTHALSGALLGRATAPLTPKPNTLTLRERTVVGFLAASFPDIDWIIQPLSPLLFLNLHRGITHSLVMLPVWAVMLSAIFAFAFTRLRKQPYRFKMFVGVCVLSLMAHIVGDVLTMYGTKVLAPLSDLRISLYTTFVIDPYFTGIIVLGLIASLCKPRLGGCAGLAALFGYVLFQSALHERAVAFGRDYAHRQDGPPTVYAFPQPFSPFNWKVVILEGDEYHATNVNLRNSRIAAQLPQGWFLSRLAASYRPQNEVRWMRYTRYGDTSYTQSLAREVWFRNAFAPYREVTALPILHRVDQNSDTTCVWFTDLRFILEGLIPPFRYGMCRTFDSNQWQLYRLRELHPTNRVLVE